MNSKEFFSNEENLKYVKKVCNRLYYNSVIYYYMELDDYQQEQLLTLSRKIKYYKEEKSKLTTFLIMCLKNGHNDIYRSVLTSSKKINNPLYTQSLDYDNDNNTETYNFVEGKDDDNSIDFILDNYKGVLNQEEIEILRYKYYGYSGKEIGEFTGTDVKHIEYKMHRIRKKLKEN